MIPLSHKSWTVYLAKHFLHFINEKDRVLDFGAGSGFMSEYLVRSKNIAPQLLDVIDYNRTNLPLTVYDGETIPFPEHSFHSAIAIAALHHIPKHKQQSLLSQLCRCASRIIIIEDTPANIFERFFNIIGDTFVNLPNGVRLSYSYRQKNDWLKLFNAVNLRPIHVKRIAPWYPIHRTLFVLEHA